MKLPVIILIALLNQGIGWFSGYTFQKRQCERKIENQKFYDGEGNEIPLYAVKLLVMSQYVVIERQDADTLTKYFHK